MAKYNVKKIEITDTMTTTLSTVCKKQSTAENRFTRFLETYDRCFTETMLKCFMNIKIVGYVNGELVSQATIKENDFTMHVQISCDTYIVSIEFHHDENTTHYKSLANFTAKTETNNDTDSTNNDTASTNDTTKTESDTNIKLTKDDINKKFGVNCVYYDTDSTNETSTDNINNVLESTFNKQLINAYVDGINNGLQNDIYKQTRECFCKLVQILPNNYEICFTTKFNVDMSKVDEPIYNHRYRIIRDITGLMFTIHKYSESQHKYIPLKPETEISDIIRYIYFRTFDSVCRVFKHDSTLEIITKLEKLFDTAEKYKNSYTWYHDNGNIKQREWREKQDSIDEFEWIENGDKYTAEYTVQISRYNVYAYGKYTKNGKKTTLTAIKNSYNRLVKAVQRE